MLPLFRLFIAVSLVAATLGGVGRSALAESAEAGSELAGLASLDERPIVDRPEQFGDGWLVPLTAVGFGRRIEAGVDGIELELPVARGLDSVLATTTVEVPADGVGGVLTATLSAAGEVLDSVEVRLGGSDAVAEVLLAGATSARPLVLSASLDAPASPATCSTVPRRRVVDLVDTHVAARGGWTAPKHLGQAWPPIVNDLILIAPGGPSATAAATLRAAAAVADANAIVPRVSVVADEADAEVGPYSLVVASAPSDDTEAQLSLEQNGLLHAVGDPSITLDPARLASTDATSIAVNAGGDEDAPAVGERRLLLSERLAPAQATGSDSVSLGFTVAQSDLGGPVTSMRLRLGGIVSPPMPEAERLVTLRVDDQLVATAPLGADGRFDLDHAVTGADLGRSAAIELMVEVPSGRERCAPRPDSVTIDLDRGSWVSGRSGDADHLVGLDAQPQAAVRGLTVTGVETEARLEAAGALVAAMAHVTRADLPIEVIADIDDAVDEVDDINPGGTLLVVGPAEVADAVASSLGDEGLPAGEAASGAMVQGARRGGVDLLHLGLGGDELPPALADSLAAGRFGGWTGPGRVVVDGAVVPIAGDEPLAAVADDQALPGLRREPSDGVGDLLRLVGLGLGVGVVTVAVVALVGAVRRRR